MAASACAMLSLAAAPKIIRTPLTLDHDVDMFLAKFCTGESNVSQEKVSRFFPKVSMVGSQGEIHAALTSYLTGIIDAELPAVGRHHHYSHSISPSSSTTLVEGSPVGYYHGKSPYSSLHQPILTWFIDKNMLNPRAAPFYPRASGTFCKCCPPPMSSI